MTQKSLIFVGAFDPAEDVLNPAASAAGNQVQAEIAVCAREEGARNGFLVRVMAFKPLRSWPRGPLLWGGARTHDVHLPSFVNFFGIRRIWFAFKILLVAFRIRPAIVIAYNPTVAECVCFLTLRLLLRNVFLVGIVQDVNIRGRLEFGARGVADWAAIKALQRFDFSVPISPEIIRDFSLDPATAFVFRGGATRQSRKLLEAVPRCVQPYCIFAGALEPYNGIDRLVTCWTQLKLPIELHVFGKGSLEPAIRMAALSDPRIHFHGFREEAEVSRMQAGALANFCLRYSTGIQAKYFFPSKLFNLLCAPGFVIANDFPQLPPEMKSFCAMVADDLSDLEDLLKAILPFRVDPKRDQRVKWLCANGNWQVPIAETFRRWNLTRKI